MTLPPELEALMPEPAFKLAWHDDGARYTVSKPNIGDTEVFTAEQMREAIRAATERAAKLCDEHGKWYFENHNSQASQSADACAEAIRGTK